MIPVLRGALSAAAQAPGGFLAGYLLGRSLGALAVGCSPIGGCGSAVPLVVALPLGTIGMGLGCGIASLRTTRWWEAVVVWAAGILALVLALAVIGRLGSSRPAGLAVALALVLLALWVGPRSWWRRSDGRSADA